MTFNHDVAPVLYHNCTYCHRPGEAAPFSLCCLIATRRKRAKPSPRSPPLTPCLHGKRRQHLIAYRDERRLSDQQIALLQAWVKDGMPEGDPAEKPSHPNLLQAGSLASRIWSWKCPPPIMSPRTAPTFIAISPCRLGLTENKWVTAIDMRPSARAVVHHVLYFADPNGHSHERQQGTEPGFGGMRAGNATVHLGGWAVGGQPSFFPEGLRAANPQRAPISSSNITSIPPANRKRRSR